MKKGISLIVLVITIIVIIILAGAVILSLSTNNPISSATNAKMQQDLVSVQSAVTMYLSEQMATSKAAVTVTAGNLSAGCALSNGGNLSFATMGMTAPSNSTATSWTVDVNGKVAYTGANY